MSLSRRALLGSTAALLAWQASAYDRAGGAPYQGFLQPQSASQAPVAVYSVRKVMPAYAGNCMAIKNSVGTSFNIGFDTSGQVNLVTLQNAINAGDGSTWTVTTWFDQSGNGFDATGGLAANGGLNYLSGLPGVDFIKKNQGLVAPANLSVGGTANLTILAVVGTYGWISGSSPYPRPGTATGVSTAVLGYGAGASSLVGGCFGLACEAAMYNQSGVLFVNAARNTLSGLGNPSSSMNYCFAFNQVGATVSAWSGGIARWAGRPHGVGSSTGQALTIGNLGDRSFAHNGPVFEVIIYNPSVPMTDVEVGKLHAFQQYSWNQANGGRYPDRRYMFGGGQSNMNNQASDIFSGDGSAGSASIVRVFNPDLYTVLDQVGNNDLEITTVCNSTSFGGSSVMKQAAAPATPTKYWWDDSLNGGLGGPGPELILCEAQLTSAAIKYQNPVMIWSQGEQDSSLSGTIPAVTAQAWSTQTLQVWSHIRAAIGVPTMPVMIQPLGRDTGHETQAYPFRLAQTQLQAAVDHHCVLIGETVNLNRQDSVHLATIPDTYGYDYVSHQNAKAMCQVIYGFASKWGSPSIASVSKSSSTTLDVSLSWPATAAGDDIPAATVFQGFLVTDNSGSRTVSDASRLAKGIIRVTVSGGALGTGITLTYSPFADTVNNLFAVLDNADINDPTNPVIAWPLTVSDAIVVS